MTLFYSDLYYVFINEKQKILYVINDILLGKAKMGMEGQD